MEGFKNIVSAGVAVGFSPVVISEVLGSYLAAFGQERIAQATVGFCVDLMFQATVKYWFSPEGQEVTVMESIQGLDYVQASASAMEGLISTQGWQGLVTSVVISCAVDGFSSERAFHEFSLGQCLQGAGSAVLVGGALELFAIRNKFGGIARSRLASGISRLVEATGSRVGKGWDMYRYLRPGAIRAADVAALFDIDEALAGVAATRIQQSPALQSLFREGDWWMSVRKMASSAENRAQLLNDLTGDVNLARAFKERPELVGAWDLLYSKLAWRIKLDHLTKVFRYSLNGLEIIQEGTDLVVKQTDGLTIGKLEIDPYEFDLTKQLKVKGEISQRYFDPDLAGGPIVRRSWENAQISNSGIEEVILHTSRFDDFEGTNQLMIGRLQQIANGEIFATPADLRYYTHELEELRRYRATGQPDGQIPSLPSEADALWENTHAATLETYSISDESTLFYSN